jgi:hypothetical protein
MESMSGQIVGAGLHNGVGRGFLATPVEELLAERGLRAERRSFA